MCGIVGFLSFDKNTSPFDIETAVQTLSHRGPDGKGVYKDDWISLGHARLSIIDLKTGDQPIFNETKNLILIVNGEIYNHSELRKDLISKGHVFRSKSDSEVIIHAYEEFGIEKALSLFNGMFAFAIWDKRLKRLILARDRIGIKPLYYSLQKNFIVFGSEIKSLTANGIVDKRLRDGCLFEYFTAHGIFGSKTMFADILELKASHYFVIDNSGKSKEVQYWNMISLLGDSAKLGDESKIINRVDNELKKSVDYRLISDVPIGVLLSGGIDSSLISAYVVNSNQINAKTTKFFNAGNINSDIDESSYAKMQIGFLEEKKGHKIDFKSMVLGNAAFLDSLPYLSYIYDEPMIFQSSGFIYKMCSSARKEGIKVLLVGEGSDELFLGYDRFWRTLNYIESKRYPRYSEEEIIFFGGGLDNVNLVERLTGKSRDCVKDIESFKWLEKYKDIDLKMEMALYFITFRLLSVLMRMDRMGMAAGTEIRVPFLDHHIVQFVNRIESDIKFKAKKPKYIVRKLSRGRVHNKIIAREKMGSPSDVEHWLNRREAEVAFNQLIDSHDSISKSELDYSVVKEIINSHYHGKKKYATLIWMLFSLEMWNRMRLEKEFVSGGSAKNGKEIFSS